MTDLAILQIKYGQLEAKQSQLMYLNTHSKNAEDKKKYQNKAMLVAMEKQEIRNQIFKLQNNKSSHDRT